MSGQIVGILLAAGTGSRFGANKLLHPLEDGVPLALHAARSLRAALGEVVAVVRDVHGEVARLLSAEGLRVACCERAAEGMGASIACGVAAASGAAGWVIGLADMPFVRPGTVAAVAAALGAGATIAAPVHDGRRGHPVGFSHRFRDDLRVLTGDVGARGLLGAYAEQVLLIECGDAGVLMDVDVPGDLGPMQAAAR